MPYVVSSKSDKNPGRFSKAYTRTRGCKNCLIWSMALVGFSSCSVGETVRVYTAHMASFKSQSVRKSKWPKSQKIDFLLTKHGEPCWVHTKN